MQAAKGIKAPSLTVFMGNLDPKVNERVLYELGCQAGPVQNVKVQHDSDSSKKSFGFITYAELESAIYCLGLYRGLLNLHGLPVNVNFANREVDATDITDEHKALLEKCKRMFAATGGEQQICGGPARRQQQSQRFTPYGAPQSRHAHYKQQQRGTGDARAAAASAAGNTWPGNDHAEYENVGRDYESGGRGYWSSGSSWQECSGYHGSYSSEQHDRASSRDYGAAYGGGYSAAAGSGYAVQDGQPQPQQLLLLQQQQQAPVPVADWQARAAAAAAEAAARLEQGSTHNSQGYQAAGQHQSYLQPPQQLQQHAYNQQQQQQQQQTAAPLPGAQGYQGSWGSTVQQQPPAPAQQHQSSLPQAIQGQAYQYQQQPQVVQYNSNNNTWQQQPQQQYQQQHQPQPQAHAVVLQVAGGVQQQAVAPQSVVQVPYQQQGGGQVLYYY